MKTEVQIRDKYLHVWTDSIASGFDLPESAYELVWDIAKKVAMWTQDTPAEKVMNEILISDLKMLILKASDFMSYSVTREVAEKRGLKILFSCARDQPVNKEWGETCDRLQKAGIIESVESNCYYTIKELPDDCIKVLTPTPSPVCNEPAEVVAEKQNPNPWFCVKCTWLTLSGRCVKGVTEKDPNATIGCKLFEPSKEQPATEKGERSCENCKWYEARPFTQPFCASPIQGCNQFKNLWQPQPASVGQGIADQMNQAR